jgi:hypothetical protein
MESCSIDDIRFVSYEIFNFIAYYLLVQLETVCGNELCFFEFSRLFESCNYYGLNTCKFTQNVLNKYSL